MKRKCLLIAAALVFLVSSMPSLFAQRIYDEFDAPTINPNRNYIDYGVIPNTFGTRFIGPMIMSDWAYREIQSVPPQHVIFTAPSDPENGSFQLPLPFTIQFDNTTFTTNDNLWVNVNGFIQVGGSDPSGNLGNGGALFQNAAPYNIIAPYWGNHEYVSAGSTQTQVSWELTGVAPRRRITIQWKNLKVNKDFPNNNNAFANFQVIIYEREFVTATVTNRQPDIEFSYGRMGNGGNVDFNSLRNVAVGLKGTNGSFYNGLSFLNTNTATTSTNLTSAVWPPSGRPDDRIRIEAFHRSSAFRSTDFVSKYIQSTDKTDRDDGYARLRIEDLAFDYTFLGEKRLNLWVNVNGFITFQDPDLYSSILTENPNGLFENSASYPEAVVAPFWGDHYLRLPNEQAVPSSNGRYVASEISYVVVGSYPTRRLIIQWKNLNIMNESLPSSIGNFQAILYEGYDNQFPSNFAGGIEFAYGDVSNNPNTPLKTVQVYDATVGLKGGRSFCIGGQFADFINGLTFNNISPAFTSQETTILWRPTGGSNNGEGRRIFFRAIPRLYVDGWGDGDANLSQTRNRKHIGTKQQRFVTAADARLILRWRLQDRSLPDSLKQDSLRLGNAYHADVNHDGRYYYSFRTFDNLRDTSFWRRPIDVDTFGVRTRMDSIESMSGMPPDAGPLRLIYFEANQHDAALILSYLSARVPSLPWIFDTIPNPKFNENAIKQASDIFVKNISKVSVDEYEVTIGINGATKSAMSLEFSVNGDIVGVQSPQNVNGNNEVDYIADNSNSKVVVATSHLFNPNDDVVTFRVKTIENILELNGVQFDVRKRSTKTVQLNSAQTGSDLSVSPMPLHNTDATISIGVDVAGIYEVALLSITGEKVYTKSVNVAANSSINEVIPVTGLNLSAGAYQVVVSNGSFVKTAKVTVLR
ncbi:MAG: hypothetical protein IPK11_01415 [Ignavibacteria bacterium]|nr:hypothetical protein [Ignavibacteria bacterium]